jgi:predicted Rossmann-fold nucleotide-binding protein
MSPMPMYLFGSDYWRPLLDFVKAHCEKFEYIDSWDEKLFSITDNIDDVVEGIHHFING